MTKRKKITREEISENLREDRELIKAHLEKFHEMSAKAGSEGSAEERAFFVYHGSRGAKLIELLIKNNESMIRHLDKEELDDSIIPEQWKEESAEPATIIKSVFGE